MPDTDITLFVSSLAGGGAHKMMLHIAKGLTELGHNVDLVLIKKEGPFVDDIPSTVSVVDLGSTRAITSIPKLVDYLNKNDPNVLLATPVIPTIPAIWATMLSRVDTQVVPRVPVVLSESNIYNNPDDISERILPYLIKLFYNYCENIVAISQGVADDLVSNFNINRGNIKVIHNPAIDETAVEKCKEEVEHEFFDTNVPVLIGVGRLSEQKDFPTLIRAFEHLLGKADARLIILGEGGEREHLEEMIHERNLSSKVDLPGFVDNPFSYMSQADVFVLSSAWEGFGNVIPESLLCGTPVVSTDCKSGPREILNNGEYGTLVEVKNESQLCEAILQTLEEPTEERRLKQRAQEFHVDTIVPKYSELID